jgi:SAM-dependent methyltransferase
MTDAKPAVDVQVEDGHYVTAKYCNPGRFAGYGHQVREVLLTKPRSVLEIGPGNGTVTYVLRQAGLDVTTLDFDAGLEPDVVGSVLELPFEADSFDTVMCCQVLEHLPADDLLPALRELARVARMSVVMSLPDASPHFYLEACAPGLGRRRLRFSMPKRGAARFDGQHYWEIGRGMSRADVRRAMAVAGLAVSKDFRVQEYRHHHFFVAGVTKP